MQHPTPSNTGTQPTATDCLTPVVRFRAARGKQWSLWPAIGQVFNKQLIDFAKYAQQRGYFILCLLYIDDRQHDVCGKGLVTIFYEYGEEIRHEKLSDVDFEDLISLQDKGVTRWIQTCGLLQGMILQASVGRKMEELVDMKEGGGFYSDEPRMS